MPLYVEVTIGRLPTPFHYRLPTSIDSASLTLGDCLLVPFRSGIKTAYFVRLIDETEVETDIKKIKDVLSISHTPFPLPPTLIKLLKWIAEYYLAPIGSVMEAGFPSFIKERWEKKSSKKQTPKIALVDTEKILSSVPLNADQKKAYTEISTAIENGGFSPFLLHGVTGSGKTEVYLQVIEKTLAQHKGAIVLVPEIGLTPQLVARFRSRFGDKIAVLHSQLTPKERYDEWLKIHENKAVIAIGARSGLFAPMSNVGVIIVDEEHDASYKQEDYNRYNARDAAIVYAKLLGATVVLGSATPSFESFYNGRIGKYKVLTLPHRVEERAMPKITMIDLRERATWITPFLTQRLLTAVEERLARHEQIILFINRRGHTHSFMCGDCGQKWQCKNCSVSLTFHKRKKKLLCHYCGFQQRAPEDCVHCKGTRLLSMGIGTEQVEEEMSALFPLARILRMDRDTTVKKGAHHQIVSAMSAKTADILIGTQMVAKGHDFHGVTLVGIVCADFSLNFPDFRSSERTFQLLAQVAGRTGRGEQKGEVLIQTFQPEHALFQVIPKYEPFYDTELTYRKDAHYPPFTKLILLILSHTKEEQVEKEAEQLADILKKISTKISNGIEVLGPAPAPITRLRNAYRYQILIKGANQSLLKSVLEQALNTFHAQHKKTSQRGVRLTIDVDPQNLI
jgi:primosomal protein N' (replication factor Y)